MIQIIPLHQNLLVYLKTHRLMKKWQKAQFLLTHDIGHPGLNVELLEPKHRKIYSFRLDRKSRGIFLYKEPARIEVMTFTKHYE